MVQVNCSAVVHLTRLYVPAMVQRRHGDVLIVASTAAFQAVPFNSVYAATKAFDLLFAKGISEELRPLGVNVCALCPGPTTTEFQQVAQQPRPRLQGGRNRGEGCARRPRRSGKREELRHFRRHEPPDDGIRAPGATPLRRKNGRKDDAP